jgi:hypothetical protein
MEHQLATVMDYIKKGEERNNKLLLSHGIAVNPTSSSIIPPKPTVTSNQSCGTHHNIIQAPSFPPTKSVPPLDQQPSVPPVSSTNPVVMQIGS